MATGNDIVKYLLLGGGAYVLYEIFSKGSVSLPFVGTVGASANSATSTSSVSSNSGAVNSGNQTSSVQGSNQSVNNPSSGVTQGPNSFANNLFTASGYQTSLTPDQWNYYVGTMPGLQNPNRDLFDPSVGRNVAVDINTYIHRLQGSGFNIAPYSYGTMGAIARMNPFMRVSGRLGELVANEDPFYHYGIALPTLGEKLFITRY
jgi:hypothetical protein